MKRLLHHDRARIVGLFTLVGLVLVVPFAARSHEGGGERLLHALRIARSMQGEPGSVPRARAGVADRAHLPPRRVLTNPTELRLTRANSVDFDVRNLRSTVIRKERSEHRAPGDAGGEAGADPDASSAPPAETLPAQLDRTAMSKSSTSAAAAPPPLSTFEGLDFANWGAGHPPDTNGDVGPTYYIQTINTSIGIYDKSNGNRVAAFTFDALMSQGQFGNLCDTDNFGDPVVLYDSFEDRWLITDFAFQLDGSGNVSPQHVYQCFAVSKTGDPVTGGWNFYSIESPGGLDDYPKFGVWPDGIYMSANMFGYSASASFMGPHVWAIDKAEMYAGAPSVDVVDFAGPSDDFTLLPANARLQTGTPPAGSPEYFVSTWKFLNAALVYKLHVDWDKISTSTFTGPDTQLAPNCWPNASVANIPTPANSLDSLGIRAMAQAQYANIGGAESVWVSHTVQRGVSATNTNCNAPTGGNAAVRWYQLNVTGGTVAANVTQGATFDPEGANTFFRWMPSLAVDRVGDMAVGYSKANATTNPQIKYAGRLVGDPVNTLGQSEQTLIDGTGSQSGNCGPSACVRWGDYSGMALDPNGCKFWETNEYYAVTGLNDQTRIGSFQFPGCTTVGDGTLSGTVTDGTNALAGVTVALGSRTTTTDGSGHYSFSVPAGTYAALSASKAGFDPGTTSSVTVPNGGSAIRNFALNAAAQSGCFTDNSQATFQRGVPTNCDLVTSPGNVILLDAPTRDVTVEDGSLNGYGFTSTSLLGQTFKPTVSGKLSSLEVYIFCSGCSGANPNITAQVRTTVSSGGNLVPNMTAGAVLATATSPGTSDGAGFFMHFTFGTPATLTAGTTYGFVVKLASNRTDGGTQAALHTSGNPYADGRADGCSTSSCSVINPAASLQFHTYMDTGFASSGSFVSSLKDANPAAGRAATWTTLSFTANKPAGTDVKFQLAGSNSQYGPFDFVGPDGTAATFFTTSGASLSQFNGFRYLRYKAILSTSDSSVTPSLTSVAVCFVDVQSGSVSANVSYVRNGSTGNTVIFTYTAGPGGLSNGALTLTVPDGWSAPSLTPGQPGYVESNLGTLSLGGTGNRTITVSGVNRLAGQLVRITYGSTTGGGVGATAPTAGGGQLWPVQEKSVSGGTLVDVLPSPSITVLAPDGSGTIAASPNTASAGSAGNTITFTYTADTGGMANGAVTVVVPSGWPAPSTTASDAGYTTSTKGTVSINNRAIIVTGITLAGGSTMTIAYGAGSGATAPTTTGAQTWTTKQRSNNAGTYTALSPQPRITVYSPDGSGSITANKSWVRNGAGGNTITFTYTTAAGGMSNGALTLAVPAGWSAPSLTPAANGYVESSLGTLSLGGTGNRTITVSGLDRVGGQLVRITYGSTTGGGVGATAPTAGGSQPWPVQEKSVSGGTLADVLPAPAITVLAPDGSGSMTPSPSSVVQGSSGNTITFTYTAATGGMVNGSMTLVVPNPWPLPSITSTDPGYSITSNGNLSASNRVITVTGINLAGGSTMTITYGAGSGATAPTTTGSQTWTTKQRSNSLGTYTAVSPQPVVTVTS